MPSVPWELPTEIELPSLPRSPYPPHDASLTTFRVKTDQVVQAGTATVGVQYTVAHDQRAGTEQGLLDLDASEED